MAEENWKDLYKKQLDKHQPSSRQADDFTEAPGNEDSTRDLSKEQAQPQKQATAKPESTDTVLLVRKIIVLIWLGITGIQIAIWLLIGIFGKQFPDPWWLWTGVSGGVVVGIVWYIGAEVQKAKTKRNV